MFFKKLIIICWLLFSFNAVAEEFAVTQESSDAFAIVTLKLKPDTKIYWRHPGEMGLPTKFDFKGSSNLRSAKVFWPTPVIYENQGIISYVYEDEVSFPIEVIAKDHSKPISLKANIHFTTCSKSCSSHEIKLNFIIEPDVPISQKTIDALNKIPHVSNDVTLQKVEQKILDDKHSLSFYLNSDRDIKNPVIFIDLPEYAHFDPSNYIFKKLKSQSDSEYLLQIFFSLDKGKEEIDEAHINIVTDDLGSLEYKYITSEGRNKSLILILLYALIGGFILNFMPCVLPILALKMLQVAKLSGKEKKLIKYDMIAQALGVITSFIIIAIVTFILKELGSQVGFGMHFQQPIYIITMSIILSLIAMNLLSKNEFHFPVPHFITKHISHKQEGGIGFFLSGVLATFLAIPCTAPFVTIAVGFAITTDFYSMFVTFTCLGIGMALPYIIIALAPSLIKIFPRPGPWMGKFKKLLGILIFVTSLWMIYIIYSQMGIRAALSLFLLIILIKFILTVKRIKKWLKIIIFIALVSLCYGVPHYIDEEQKQEAILKDQVWEEYNPNKINTLINEDIVVVLDVTASWCPTCKINKLTTIDNMLVVNFMRKNNIIGMRADISESSSPEVFALMQKHSHYGIPFNIVYSKKYPQGLVLPTILMPNILLSNIKKADPKLAQ